MLGTRTKQVFSYGKRNQRIVDVCEEHDRLKKTSVTSIFDDLTPAPQWAPVVSKMRKRENVKPKSPPNIILMQKKKRLSPVLTPARKKRTRVAQVSKEVHNYETSVTKSKLKAAEPSQAPTASDNSIPLRAPLSLFPLNTLGSPAISGNLPKMPRVPAAEGTPLKKLNNLVPHSTTFPVPQLHPQSTWYQRFPSPIARPRQLTPMRGGRGNRLFEPPSPPSPSTPTDLDLDFSRLDLNLGLSPSQANASLSLPDPEIPQYLRPLLSECHQETCGPHEFSAFIETFPFDPIVRSADVDTGRFNEVRFRKIGEASYSEVFGIGDVVLKVIPLRDESPDAGTNNNKLRMIVKYNEHGEEQDEPPPSDAKDVLKEIIVTRAMGELCTGFVKLLRTYIVKGKYPELLLELWDEFYKRKGSESVRPDTFNVSQVYAIIVLPNGGPDLETYTFTNANKSGWTQACSIFWQVAKALAHAEQLVSFEHRDLHWGQVLVKNIPGTAVPPLKTQNQNQGSIPKSATLMMDDQGHGVRATLIDLGLARMDAGDGAGGERVHWTPFDEEVFMGQGDYQFDVYRIMREHNGGAWEEFKPLTNVMWLHYLSLKLLHCKRLKVVVTPRKGHAAAPPIYSAAGFAERDCYKCLVDIEDWLGKCVAGVFPQPRPKVPVKGRGKRKEPAKIKTAALLGPLCAGEVVEYGVKRGWIKSPS